MKHDDYGLRMATYILLLVILGFYAYVEVDKYLKEERIIKLEEINKSTGWNSYSNLTTLVAVDGATITNLNASYICGGGGSAVIVTKYEK